MYSSNGFEGIPDIKFEEVVNGEDVAARGEQTGVIYINIEELLGKTPTEVVSILAHEAVHSEKITQSSGSKLTEEIFVKDKESQVADKFKEEKEGLSEKEQKEQEEYLAELDKDNEDLREYSEKLQADSFSEEVEGFHNLWSLTLGNEENYGKYDNKLKNTYENLGQAFGGENGKKIGELAYYGADIFLGAYGIYNGTRELISLGKASSSLKFDKRLLSSSEYILQEYDTYLKGGSLTLSLAGDSNGLYSYWEKYKDNKKSNSSNSNKK